MSHAPTTIAPPPRLSLIRPSPLGHGGKFVIFWRLQGPGPEGFAKTLLDLPCRPCARPRPQASMYAIGAGGHVRVCAASASIIARHTDDTTRTEIVTDGVDGSAVLRGLTACRYVLRRSHLSLIFPQWTFFQVNIPW